MAKSNCTEKISIDMKRMDQITKKKSTAMNVAENATNEKEEIIINDIMLIDIMIVRPLTIEVNIRRMDIEIVC